LNEFKGPEKRPLTAGTNHRRHRESEIEESDSWLERTHCDESSHRAAALMQLERITGSLRSSNPEITALPTHVRAYGTPDS